MNAIVRRITRPALYVLLFLTTLIPLFPLFWLGMSSVKSPEEMTKSPASWWPESAQWSNYAEVFRAVPFARSFGNSAVIVGVCTLSVLITSTFAGFVFAKYRFKGRDTIFWTVMTTMFLPPVVTLVPLYSIIQSLGLNDRFIGVMLPWLTNAFGIFLMRQFIQGIPDELLEAARVDGASEFRIIVQLVVPLIKPATITLAVFCVVYYWNSFLWPLSVLQTPEKFPVILTLSRLLSYNMSVQYQAVVLAGAVIASLPTLLIFLATQRVFVQGIAASGIKG